MLNFEKYPDLWYQKLARRVGVPELWLEDALQEMKLAAWQGRNIQYAAIDFVRQYGAHTRKGVERFQGTLNESVEPKTGLDQASWIDLQDQFKRLPGKLQQVVQAHLFGFRDIEIAQKLHMSPKWVGELRRKGLAALQ